MKGLPLLPIGELMKKLLLVLSPAGLLLAQNAEISWTIEADEIEIDPRTGLFHAKTEVRIQYKKDTPEAIELTFDLGSFSRSTGDINATSNVTLRHKGAELTSDQASINIENGVANASGNITLRHKETELTVDHASFNLRSGDINATGNVTLRHGDTVITLDRASFNVKSGNVNAIGNVVLKRDGKVWESEQMDYNFHTKVINIPSNPDSKTTAIKNPYPEEPQSDKNGSQIPRSLIIGTILLILTGCGLYKLSSKKAG